MVRRQAAGHSSPVAGLIRGWKLSFLIRTTGSTISHGSSDVYEPRAGDFPFALLFAMQLAIRSGAELGPASYQGSQFQSLIAASAGYPRLAEALLH